MAKRRIDWAAVRASRDRLDAIACAHPELLGDATANEWEAALKESDEMKTTQTAFRLPTDLIERLDDYVQRMNEEQPGIDLTRADVVRMLLTKGLDAAGARPKKRAKK